MTRNKRINRFLYYSNIKLSYLFTIFKSGPQFVQPLPSDFGQIEEGEPLHLECKVEPLGDNTLQIYWLRDSHPLPHAHRFRTFHDFGYISLDILYVYAEDSGTYTCVAENALGKTETTTQFTCEGNFKLLNRRVVINYIIIC